ncbi:hypothetical protein Tco_0222171 [Tanacetum coccineum]
MLAERRYPLSRELMIRMLDHGMEVEDESEIAITLIHLFILWTTEDVLATPKQTAFGKENSNPLIALIVCSKLYGSQLTNVLLLRVGLVCAQLATVVCSSPMDYLPFLSTKELTSPRVNGYLTSHHNTDQSATSLVKIKAPMELPKLSLVNTSLKNLKDHLGKFNTVVKKRIIPDAITEGE